MKRPLVVPVLALLSLSTAAPAAAYNGGATLVTYTLAMDGAQVDPSGTGDPDGTASGTISLSDLAGVITFSIFFADIDDPESMHIHLGVGGAEGDALVTLPVSTGVDPNPLVGTVAPSLSALQSIIANPTAFYVDIHTPAFPNGAVRGAVPEPSAAALLGTGLALLSAMRRRRGPR
jgi:hypothetical protein